MPFKSKAQEKAAFAGGLGPEMKAKAKEFAAKTDQSKIPDKVHHSGKGTRARLNTAAEKQMFGARSKTNK